MIVGRFAPSPTGRMHAGNIYAALLAWLVAKKGGGDVVLRIEDLDLQRSRPEFVDAIMRDFEYLGLTWDRGPFFQSERSDVYRDAANVLKARDLLYPCFCSRSDLHVSSAPHAGEKIPYNGACCHLSSDEVTRLYALRKPAVRLRVPPKTITFHDAVQGDYAQNLAHECGDFLIKRSDGVYAYHLAVVIDDAEQGITSVVRGCDLMESTPQQLYLQDLLALPHPAYTHIPLLVGKPKERLAKRDNAAGMEALRACFKTPEALLGHIAQLTGIVADCGPVSADELLDLFSLELLFGKKEIAWT